MLDMLGSALQNWEELELLLLVNCDIHKTHGLDTKTRVPVICDWICQKPA